MRKIYLQYGCGLSAPEGWLNYDSSPRLRMERMRILGAVAKISRLAVFPDSVLYGDIRKGLPIQNSTVCAIYASHVLEHLPRSALPQVLLNTYKLLCPGGVFRLIVPDLSWRIDRYISARESGDQFAADKFIASCSMGKASPNESIMDYLRSAIGNSEHRWMYDRQLMKQLLVDAGFANIRDCKIGDSGDQMFNLVERADRFIESGYEEVAIEAVRT